MIKFIIICLILIFVVARFFDYILYIVRLLSGKEEAKTFTFGKKNKNKAEDVDVKFEQKKSYKRKPFSGGEYIDFQEVKEDKSEEK